MVSMSAEDAIATFQSLLANVPPDKSFQLHMKVNLFDEPKSSSTSKPIVLGSGGCFKDLTDPMSSPFVQTLLSGSSATSSSSAGYTLRSQKGDIWQMSAAEDDDDPTLQVRKKRSMVGLAEINELSSSYDPPTPKAREPDTEYENLDVSTPRSETIYTQKSEGSVDEDGNIWVRVEDVFD